LSAPVDVSDWIVYMPAVLQLLLAIVALLHIRRLRFARALLATAFAILLIVMAFTDVFFIRFAPRERGQREWSPDGKHVALLRYELLGAFGDDREVLVIRHAWSPFGEESYLGPRENSNPRMTWLDGHRLSIDIQTRACGQQVASVSIVCGNGPVGAAAY
jgi:hypothetical protein